MDHPNPNELFEEEPSRITRIEHGSGAKSGEIMGLLSLYTTLANMIETMGGMFGPMLEIFKVT